LGAGFSRFAATSRVHDITVQGLTTKLRTRDRRIVAHTNTDAQGLLKPT
jgi:hypothetical protein